MRHFRFIKSFLLLLLALWVSVDVARADNECFEQDYNFTAYGTLDRVVHIKVLAYASGGFDHWAGNNSKGSVKFHKFNTDGSISFDEKKGDFNYEANMVEFFKYQSENFSLEKNQMFGTLKHLECVVGTIRWTDPKTNQIMTLEAGKSTGSYVMKREKIDDNRDAFFVEFDWIHPVPITANGSENEMDLFAIQFDIRDERSVDTKDRKHTVPTLSTVSTLMTPEFVTAVYNMDDYNTQIGSLTAAMMGSGNIKGYTIYSNGEKILESSYPSGKEYFATCILPQDDKVRTLSADVKFEDPSFAAVDAQGKPVRNGQTRVLHTKTPLIVQPVHSIVPDTIRENASESFNNGYNVLTWAFNNPDEEDFISNDAFVISRGYNPDFSDQVQIGTASMTQFASYETRPTSEGGSSSEYADVKNENVKGFFKFEDKTIEASYNANGTNAFDEGKLYNVTGLTMDDCLRAFATDEKDAAREFIKKYLEIPVRKVYYTVERLFIKQMYRGDYSKMENRDRFVYRDSVYKSVQLPHVTDVTVQKSPNWQYDHKVKVRVRLDNYTLREIFTNEGTAPKVSQTAVNRLLDIAEKNGFKSRLYTWDNLANIKLTRYDAEGADEKDITTRTDVFSGNAVKLSEDGSYYYLEVEDVMLKPFTSYQYGASVDASNSRYPIINNEEYKTKYDENTFRYDERAFASAVTASKGYYNDQIFVKWPKVEGQRSHIKLYRRSLDVPGSKYEEIADVSDNTTYYRDTKNVAGGKWFMYKLEVTLDYKNTSFTSADSVAGSTSVYGEVSGVVRLQNGGSSMADVTVTATKVTGDESVEQRALSLPITELINNQKFLAMATKENLPLDETYSLQFWTKAKGTTYTDKSDGVERKYDISPTHNSFVVGGDSIFIDGKGKVFLNEQPAPSSAIDEKKYPSSEYVCYTLNRNLKDGSFTVYIDTINVGTINVPAQANADKSLPFAIISNWHVDEMRVFNRCLSEEEVKNFSKRVLSGREQGLVAYYHFDEKAEFCQGVAADAAYQTASDATRYDLYLYSNGELVTDETLLKQMTDDDKFDVSGLLKSAVTGPDGKYVISGLSTNDGVTYTIVPSAGGSSAFRYTKTNEPQATLEFNGSRNSYTDTDFEFTSTVRFAGRVMYKNTTVPVRDAIFKINGQNVVSGNGTVIRTDQNGSFAFDVPCITMTFQVVKEGHIFQNDGYVYENGRTEEAILFTPSEDYIGLEIWDNTKVRVAGRIVGGATQASKPLGMAQSVNNLGDDITMVMALEGDNTSNLLYIKGEEDVKTKSETLVVNTAEAWWQDGQKENPFAISTKTVMERQRLTVYPDVRTGEFYIDLLPVRYKVTQLYANGYSTLFSTGETAQVLDLTNAFSSFVEDSVNVEYEGQTKMLRTSYNQKYTRTYHSPVSVSYKQLVYGAEEDYFGEEKMSSMDKFGSESSIKVVERDAETNKHNYLFGMPVFQQDNHYVFSVYAHEDFYYNNDSIQGHHEQVMTPNCKVAINNGLKDSDNAEEVVLEENGMTFINFTAGSPTFSDADDAAVRTITFDALVDGKYYSSAPLRCLLVGDRLKEGSVVTYPMADTRLLDVLRDPPGSTSYSFVEDGARYNLGRKFDLSVTTNFNMEFGQGPANQTILGTIAGFGGTGTLAAQLITGETISEPAVIPAPVGSYIRNRHAEYEMILTDRIQTSSDPLDVGAMADVYIGSTENLIMGMTESYCVISEEVFNALSASFTGGDNKVIAKGVNQDGKTYYIVTGNKVASTMSNPVSFAYSQKHIINNVIPQLLAKRNSLLRNIPVAEAQRMADATGNVYYVTDSIHGQSESFGVDGTYSMVVPAGVNHELYIDEVKTCNEQVMKWLFMIYTNELWKLQALAGGMEYKSYSLSGNIPVSHIESGNVQDIGWTDVGMVLGVPVNIGGAAAQYASGQIFPQIALGFINFAFTFIPEASKNKYTKPYKLSEILQETTGMIDKAGGNSTEVNVRAGESRTVVHLYPTIDYSFTDDMTFETRETRTTGYYLAADGDSYMDVSIYRTPADSVKMTADVANAMYWIAEKKVSKDDLRNMAISNYVFDVKGGASRPWYEPDSTLVLTPTLPLSGKTLKIDNPRLNIPQAIVSNIPQDEKAVFTLNMTNDSELPAGQKLSGASTFTLYVDDSSNPDGLKITMDGEPLTNGRQFIIAPHETMTKTIELTRGRKYDYENINLVLSTSDCRLSDVKPIAVHFMPTSSPVRITSPTNNWTLNTNASQDSLGYYMPIVVEGFDVTYQGFDHIEIQYKPSTKGDDSWVNLCSYYASDSLYQAATGNKAKITSGIINDFRFYGDRDPMEMKYDLRAVCFSRMGTDFVTRSSEVMTGMKDTRQPRIIGMPEPKTGIVGYGEHITFAFTEPIAYNYLDQTSNFDVLGFINDNTEINNSSALSFPGTADQKAESTVERNLRMRNFSIDMLVSAQEGNRKQVLMSHGTTNGLSFGFTEKNQLYLQMNGQTFVGNVHHAAEINGAMVHVGVTYNQSTRKACFFFGNAFETDTKGQVRDTVFSSPYEVSGIVRLGYDQSSAKDKSYFAGKMLEVRIWNSDLTAEQVSNYNQKVVSGYNNQMIAHWPLNQTVGNVATDEVSGANLYLGGTQWSTRQSFSLALNKRPVTLAADYFTRSNLSDYTLSFWFKSQTPEIAKGDTVSIFSIGKNDTLSTSRIMRLQFVGDTLLYRSGQKYFDLGKTYNDGDWHHFGVSVNRSKNQAIVMIDGALKSQLAGDDVKGLASDYAALGDTTFVGRIDDVVLYNRSINTTYEALFYNTVPDITSPELTIYLPFSQVRESSQGLVEEVYSPNNAILQNNAVAGVKLVTDDNAVGDKTDWAPIREPERLSKLEFDWSSNGTDLYLHLLTPASKVNKQNVFINIRDVQDINGNTMAEAQSYAMYIDCNQLVWSEEYMKTLLNYGTEEILTAQFINKGSTVCHFNITTNVDWIELAYDEGSIAPNSTLENYLNIKSGLDPGIYIGLVTLTDDNGLSSTLEVYATILAEEPKWEIDKRYRLTASLIGEVHIVTDYYDNIDDNVLDIVGAFNSKGDCVGKSYITSNEMGQGAVFLTIFGDNDMDHDKDPITFRLWRSDKGTATQLVPTPEILFAKDTVYGQTKPVRLSTSNQVWQTLALQEGWNWISLNVAPNAASTLNNVFADKKQFTEGDEIREGLVVTNFANGEWPTGGTWMKTLANGKVYQVKVAKEGNYSVLGTSLTDAQKVVELQPGNMWQQLPYPVDVTLSVRDALADYQSGDKASVGDIIKSYNEFTILSADNTWVGSLRNFVPGVGYYIQRAAESKYCTIDFSKVKAVNSSPAARAVAAARAVSHNAMPVVAVFDPDCFDVDPTDKLIALVNGEKVAEAKVVETANAYLYFLTLNEVEGQKVELAQERDGEIINISTSNIRMSGNGVLGTLDRPFVVSLTNNIADVLYYDMQGRRIPALMPGLNIIEIVRKDGSIQSYKFFKK